MNIHFTPSQGEKRSIETITIEFRQAHEEVIQLGRRTLECARRAGELLLEVKGLLAHGQWKPWLDGVGLPQRTANNYTLIAKRWSEVEGLLHTEPGIGIAAALLWLRGSARGRGSAEPSSPAVASLSESVMVDDVPAEVPEPTLKQLIGDDDSFEAVERVDAVMKRDAGAVLTHLVHGVARYIDEYEDDLRELRDAITAELRNRKVRREHEQRVANEPQETA